MTEVYRTPDERFDGPPGLPLRAPLPRGRRPAPRPPRRGRRLAGRVLPRRADLVVPLAQGDPAGSRRRPSLHRARLRGLRPIGQAHDLDWYSYDRHAEPDGDLLEDLDLRDATVVVHDWGGPIGLRLAVEHPDRIARMVVMDTGLFTGEQPMSDAWHDLPRLRRADRGPTDLDAGRERVARGMNDDVVAAYDAPFPTAESKAGARAFPLMLPTSPEMPGGARAGKRVPGGAARRRAADARDVGRLGSRAPVQGRGGLLEPDRCRPTDKIENASHFLQEDAGEEIGQRIADWLRAQ